MCDQIENRLQRSVLSLNTIQLIFGGVVLRYIHIISFYATHSFPFLTSFDDTILIC